MKRKRCLKCFAVLLAVLMLCAVLTTVASAGIVDVSEDDEDGIIITRTYDTTINIYIWEVTAEGLLTDEKAGELTVHNSLDLATEEGEASVFASEEAAKAELSDEYELYDRKEKSLILYSSPQILDQDGDVISTYTADELIDAYIGNGIPVDILEICKVETLDIHYKARRKETAAEPQAVPVVKIENATLSFNAEEAPEFTAEASEPELYYVYLEMWNEVGGDKYITSSDFFNRDEELLIKQFEKGKEYTYSVWVKPCDVYADNGDFLCYATTLSDCGKLVLNGKDITVTADMTSDMEEAGIWLNKVSSFTVSNSDKSLQTDGNSRWVLWIILPVLAVAGLTAVLIYGKKRNKSDRK